jgi:hypothetical protein
MHDELIRAVVAAPVVVALPAALGGTLESRIRRAVFCAVLMIAALAPYLGSLRAWAIIVIVVAIASLPAHPSMKHLRMAAAQALLAAFAAAAIADQTAARHAAARISDTPNVVIVIAGLLAVVFLGGALIGQLLHPFAMRLGGDSVSGIENAGRMIGWLERTLLYGLVIAGAPDAAAIVIAAKSVARFPSFAEAKFAEYYLIGTLLSFLTAAAVGVAVRAALGLHPLLSSNP